MHNPYQQLTEIFKKISHLNNILSILRWDSSVIMQKGSIDTRSEQMAYLASAIYETLSNGKVAELIDKVSIEELSDLDKVNYKLMKKTYKYNTAISAKHTEAIAIAKSKSEMIWREAKIENNYKLFAPYLKETLNLIKQAAEIRSSMFNLSIYDSLLDSHEPEFLSNEIDIIFDDLRKFLPEFIGKVVEFQKSKYSNYNQNNVFTLPIALQKEIGIEFMKLMGFDFSKGRLDSSEHPFCGGFSQDVRITSRYQENNFLSGLMAIIHETGHAIYEQNLPANYLYQPVGQIVGMATHESQSLIWEYQVGRSKEFFEFLGNILKKKFNLTGKQFESKNMYYAMNKVQPSFIRVDADEVTYPVHVILRYNLEKALINNELDVYDLPIAWNEAMGKMLGIKPTSDKEGCLQDIHWSLGAFGYFPFYAIGAMTASQLYNSYSQKSNNNIALGNFEDLRMWLNHNVHQHGSRSNLQELLKNSTGHSLSADHYKNYLNNKFLESNYS